MFAALYPYLKKTPFVSALAKGPVATAHDPAALPKHIYMFWDNGLEQAPDLIKACAESWSSKNPDWTFTCLDQDAANSILNRRDLPTNMSVQAYADVLRTEVLSTRGGVWVDATLLCVTPLKQWLVPLFNQTDFFAFQRPGADRLISSWFLASAPNAPLICIWNRQAHRFWRIKPKFYTPYFWLHYMFEYLVRMNRPARQSWAHVPRLSAEPCHILSKAHNTGGVDENARIRAAQSFVQKLSLKTGMNNDIANHLNGPDDPFTSRTEGDGH